jgi:hypothetical protein
MDRVVLVAHLKPGSRQRAEELLAESSSREDINAAFNRRAVFLSETEVVFFFEGPDAERRSERFQRPQRERNRSLDSTLRRTVALGPGGVLPGIERLGRRIKRT